MIETETIANPNDIPADYVEAYVIEVLDRNHVTHEITRPIRDAQEALRVAERAQLDPEAIAVHIQTYRVSPLELLAN